MTGSVNKVTLVGNLGADPEIKRMQNGDALANLRIATSETWRDKASGERKERTEWHTVVIFNDGLVKVAEQYLRKGSKVYIEGALQTRSWDDQSGQKRYATEIVLQRFRGELVMLDGSSGGQERGQGERPRSGEREDRSGYGARQGGGYGADKGRSSGIGRQERDEFADEIPF